VVTRLTQDIPPELVKLGPQVVGFLQSILDNLGGASESGDGVSQADFDALEVRVDDLESGGGSGSFTSTDQTITASTLLTIPHGLGAEPSKIAAWLIPLGSVEGNYPAGRPVSVSTNGVMYTTSGGLLRNLGVTVSADATNLYAVYGAGDTGAVPPPVFQLHALSTGGAYTIGVLFAATNASWTLRLIAEL
jgi:hypothetical protein